MVPLHRYCVPLFFIEEKYMTNNGETVVLEFSDQVTEALFVVHKLLQEGLLKKHFPIVTTKALRIKVFEVHPPGQGDDMGIYQNIEVDLGYHGVATPSIHIHIQLREGPKNFWTADYVGFRDSEFKWHAALGREEVSQIRCHGSVLYQRD